MSDSQSPWTFNQPDTQVADGMTEVTEKSWFGRMRDSFLGALIGLVLIVVSVVLLSWNEKSELYQMRALSFGAASVVEASADQVDPALNGKLVHVSGNLAAPAPAHDPLFGAVTPDAIRLQRHVEMFQWQEHSSSSTQKSVGGSSTTTTNYEYRPVWSETPIDSSHFHAPAGHANPSMPLRSTITDASDVKLGVHLLAPGVLDRLNGFAAVAPGGTAALPDGWRVADDAVYRGGDPSQPAVGDLRVHFSALPAGTVSVVAAQQGDRLAPFMASNGTRIALAVPGVADAHTMFGAARSQASSMAWILRGVGFVLCLVGLVLCVRPLAVLVSVLPFLESVVDVAAVIVMFGVAALVTLATIAVARFVLQPLLSIGLLAAGVAIVVATVKLRGRPARAAMR